MKLLLHVCCGPCTLYPVQVLRREGVEPVAYFANPNIHPYREFRRRLTTMEEVADRLRLTCLYERDYGLESYLRAVVHRERMRCRLCYRMRLAEAAAQAGRMGLDGFTTTLLYSKYQDHGLIRKVAESVAAEQGVPFVYRDFRTGWQAGVDMAVEMGIYRQPYCGCIYSEQERYDNRLKKRLRKRRRAAMTAETKE